MTLCVPHNNRLHNSGGGRGGAATPNCTLHVPVNLATFSITYVTVGTHVSLEYSHKSVIVLNPFCKFTIAAYSEYEYFTFRYKLVACILSCGVRIVNVRSFVDYLEQ